MFNIVKGILWAMAGVFGDIFLLIFNVLSPLLFDPLKAEALELRGNESEKEALEKIATAFKRNKRLRWKALDPERNPAMVGLYVLTNNLRFLLEILATQVLLESSNEGRNITLVKHVRFGWLLRFFGFEGYAEPTPLADIAPTRGGDVTYLPWKIIHGPSGEVVETSLLVRLVNFLTQKRVVQFLTASGEADMWQFSNAERSWRKLMWLVEVTLSQ